MIRNKEMFPRGYLKDKNNILFELNEYIKEYNSVKNIGKTTIKSEKIYNAIVRQKYKLEDLVKELGYDIDELNPVQTKTYGDIENLKIVINEFIGIHKRFPTVSEFQKTLGINTHVIDKYGGIHNMKRLLKWNDEFDLVDDRGWYNKSTYEYITAQYLIHNNISYKREQHPFLEPYSDYRSDFTFETLDGTTIHCEVWGMEDIDYEKTKNRKIELYEKYNIHLISLNHTIFTQSYKKTQDDLFKIFSPYFKLEFKYFDNEIIIPYIKLTDEEILNELLKHSKDGETLPTVKYLKKNHIYMLYYEANKRYNGYYNFASKFGKKTTRVDVKTSGEENIKRLFNLYLEMIHEFGYILGNEVAKYNDKYKIVLSIEKQQFNGRVNSRLAFYQYCIDNYIQLPDIELIYWSHIFDGQDRKISNHATPLQQQKAKQLLQQYNNQLNHNNKTKITKEVPA